MEDNESSGGLAIKTGKENLEPTKSGLHEEDDFHSVPSTPLEAVSHVGYGKVEDKEDFS